MVDDVYFTRAAFEFLQDLRANNNRDWFLANKGRYEKQVRDPFLRLIADLRPELAQIKSPFVADPSPNGGSMMRIYRDIRFSKDKSPYKTHAAAHFRHGKAKDGAAPVLYLRIEPGASVVGGGVWQPDSRTLKRIRNGIVADEHGWRRVTARLEVGPGCNLAGTSLRRPPAGYRADHPLIEDIKRKDFAVSSRLTDREVCGRDLMTQLLERFRATAPFLQFLSDAVGLS